METLENIFAYAKEKLHYDMDVLEYEVFLGEITKKLKEQIHEHISVLEIVKLTVLLMMLKRKAGIFNIPHKLDSLLEVVESSTVIRSGKYYENQPLSLVILEYQSLPEQELKKKYEMLFFGTTSLGNFQGFLYYLAFSKQSRK